MEIQLDFLRIMWDSLGSLLQANQTQILSVLQMKPAQPLIEIDEVRLFEKDEASALRNKLSRFGKKVKFATAPKDCIENTVDELERWHARFDPSWWLILRIRNPAIDQQLASRENPRKGSVETLRTLRNGLSAQETNKRPQTFHYVHEKSLLLDRQSIAGSS